MKKAIISLCALLLVAKPAFPADSLSSNISKEPLYLCNSNIYSGSHSMTFFQEPEQEKAEELEINESDNFLQKVFKKTYNLSYGIHEKISFLEESVDKKTTFKFLGGELKAGYNEGYNSRDCNIPAYFGLGYQKPIDFSFENFFGLFRREKQTAKSQTP